MITSDISLEKVVRLVSVLCVLAFSILLIVPFLYFINFTGNFSADQAIWGAFGDYLGGILNPIFALFAFIVLVVAILLQANELEAVRIDLASSSRAMNEQAASLKKNGFETTFFSMLNMHEELVGKIIYQDGSNQHNGRTAFEKYYADLKRKISLRIQTLQNADKSLLPERATITAINEVYDEFFVEYEAELGHYFRFLYQLVKFINDSDFSDSPLYTELVRAQLSTYELLLLFYNCISSPSKGKFKPLIEKQSLFRGLSVDKLVEKSHHHLYKSSAYTKT